MAYFLKRERKSLEVDGWEGEEDKGGDEGGEMSIRIYCMRNLFLRKKVDYLEKKK